MSLLKISLRPHRNPFLIMALRNPTYHARAMPPTAPKQLSFPSENGFFSYQRNWSRDKKYDLTQAPQKGDTPFRFLTRRLDHAYELYPLLFLIGVCFSLVTFTAWYSFNKLEIWLDKSIGRDAPWAWERIRDKYWKMETLLGDMDGRSHQRLEMMEILEDEMMEAAKKRNAQYGTHYERDRTDD